MCETKTFPRNLYILSLFWVNVRVASMVASSSLSRLSSFVHCLTLFALTGRQSGNVRLRSESILLFLNEVFRKECKRERERMCDMLWKNANERYQYWDRKTVCRMSNQYLPVTIHVCIFRISGTRSKWVIPCKWAVRISRIAFQPVN